MVNAVLRDPVTGGHLLDAAPSNNPGLVAPALLGCDAEAIGITDLMVQVADGSAAYPVVDGIPVLMSTERLASERVEIQVAGTNFEEAYQEQKLYTELASSVLGSSARGLEEVRRVVETADPSRFPEPPESWFGGGSTAGAYLKAMRHLAPVADCTVLQIGGVGTHALKLLHAGAERALIVSPVIGELVEGRAIAAEVGLADRATFVGGVAEQLPIADSSIDRVYSGSSIHHTDTSQSFAEISRVLSPLGRWASVDVWKSTFHDVGTRLFGKCHGNPYCHPLSPVRIAPAKDAFDDCVASFHGGTVRYPLAVAERAGFRPDAKLGIQLASIEDKIKLGPLTEALSSLVCLTGSRRS